MPTTDLYEILEVDRNVSSEDLKKAYRRLARQLHPDANPGDAASEARFKEVSQAYEILSDPERRANYDRFGQDVGAGGNPFGGGSVQDIFDMFFGGMGGHVPPSVVVPSPVPTPKSPSRSPSRKRPSAPTARSPSPCPSAAAPARERDAPKARRP